MNDKQHWIIFLILNTTSILDKNLSNIMFTEPINKSDNREQQQQEDFPKEELKGTQTTNDWENKEVAFY